MKTIVFCKETKHQAVQLGIIIKKLEIKTSGLGSRIQDIALWDESNIALERQMVCTLYSIFGL